jgi:hypothetical protein
MGAIRSRAGARLFADAQLAKWRASESKRAAQRRNARARPWQAHGQTGVTGLISNGYAGVRVARREEAPADGKGQAA